jgi:hypothetical protein
MLALLAFGAGSRSVSCVFVWQACLLQEVVLANSKPSPLDLILLLFGLLLGVPIYSALTYAVVTFWRRSRIRKES